MKVTFYGTRGSIPTPGENTVKYGGNTACVLIVADNKKLILDAGTGIKKLGEELISNNDPVTIILSHNHWDHIQGFPFFVPAYQKNRQINIYSAPTNPVEHNAIIEQMNMSTFPLSFKDLSADIKIIPFKNKFENMIINGFSISSIHINHPNGGFAYKICHNNKAVAYVTDNEVYSKDNLNTDFTEWIDFLRDVDFLIHDAQYTDLEMPLKLGWGHSSIDQAVKLAKAAKVKVLVLYSHAPERTDTELDKIIKDMQFKELQIIASQEGITHNI
ncbi:MBL fold metallo-hydrolase [Pseudoalteromonas sp. NBT06-2]|uniref:MBL fold metallo-hydrolase n=1 Tax=Pseudoalteromonas sp. NBT06-2 TaxID=2025950 RepID=UPI000BA69F63|nr:MBL fold metallo-hydrolase [Pseudoalteromonas sp. NBT06-2]PAJ75817.1 MBL fold metallo-hydrolase [Pseudoalteromonas sp. NBT06-2]